MAFTTRMAVKGVLRHSLRHTAYKDLTVKQFDLRCCEILDAYIRPGSASAEEVDRMDKACTLGRMFREVRRELDRE